MIVRTCGGGGAAVRFWAAAAALLIDRGGSAQPRAARGNQNRISVLFPQYAQEEGLQLGRARYDDARRRQAKTRTSACSRSAARMSSYAAAAVDAAHPDDVRLLHLRRAAVTEIPWKAVALKAAAAVVGVMHRPLCG
jgi:hypothetical protein